MKRLISSVFALAFAAVALAQTGCSDGRASASANSAFDRAVAAYRAYEDTEAARLFALAAEQGDGKAETILAMLYIAGEGVPQDMVEGKRRLRVAAERGSSGAGLMTGILLLSEAGASELSETKREEQFLEAVRWIKRAADQGSTHAQTTLGGMYFTCRISKDCKNGPSQALVGAGIPIDEAAALRLIYMAAESGNADGLVQMGDWYLNRGRGAFENRMNKDAAEAVRCYKMAAEKGDAKGQTKLGDMHWFGEGVPENAVEAVRWYRRSAEQGYAEGQYGLGTMYGAGLGVPENGAEAARWFERAADQGHNMAQFKLAHMYLEGDVVPPDYVQAFKWFNIMAAASTRNEAAQTGKEKLRRMMTPEQIAEAQRLSAEWKPKRKMEQLLSFLE